MLLPIVLLAISAPDLSISLGSSSPTPAQIGSTVSLDLSITNLGTDASGVTVTETVPPGTRYAAAQSSAWSCFDGAAGRTACTASIGAMPAGAQRSLRFAVSVVSAVGTIADRASVTESLGSNRAAELNLRATDPTTTTQLGANTLRSVNVGPNRTALYTNEPPNTPPNIARLIMPRNYTGATELPLVMMLHGLDGSADAISAQFGHRFATGVDRRNYMVLLPNGTLGPRNHRHWNATDVCCNANAGSPNRDDVGYLRDLINEAEQNYRVDVRRVYVVVGFSNGAFMSYRLACEIPEMLAGIAPIAGATFQNESLCVRSTPVSVLHIHGTADPNVHFYDYNADPDNDPSTPVIMERPDVPGAVQSLSRFASKAGCDTAQLLTRPTPINIWHAHTESASNSPRGTIGAGDETTVRGFDAVCQSGYDFDLWEIALGTHAVWFEYDLRQISDGIYPNDRILDWFFVHAR